MRRISGLLAGAMALCGVSVAPASAVLVRFDIQEIGTLFASGGVFELEVATFEGFLLFDFVDNDEDGAFDAGTLVDLRLTATGPISGTSPGQEQFALEFSTMPGGIDFLQIPDGTTFEFLVPRSDPQEFEMATAANPTGTLAPSLEVPGAERFEFDNGEFLSIEGAPDTGLLDCTNVPPGPPNALCFLAESNLPETPPGFVGILDLSGPQAPIAVDASATFSPFFDIEGLDTIETTPASLTGDFAFLLGDFDVRFPILSASGVIVPEPGTGLGIAASVGTLALLSRRRRRA